MSHNSSLTTRQTGIVEWGHGSSIQKHLHKQSFALLARLKTT